MAKPKTSAPEPSAPAVASLVTVADLVHLDPSALTLLLANYLAGLRREHAKLPKVAALSKDERIRSPGRIAADELDGLVFLLDAVDANKAVFQVLAPKDHGRDPDRVETEPVRQAIEVLKALSPLADALKKAASDVTDIQLRLGEFVRAVTTPAYAIGTANAPLSEPLRAAMLPVTEHYKRRRAAKKPRKGARNTP